MRSDDLPNRKRLYHDTPSWIEDGSLFFITVNCQDRGREQLTLRNISTGILDASRFYQEHHKWHISLLVLMPDHFHAIMSFPRYAAMDVLFRNWKRYTSRQWGIVWQNGFFEHRLRSNEEITAKHHYICQNPVRAGLCQTSDDWPHQMQWSSSLGGDLR